MPFVDTNTFGVNERCPAGRNATFHSPSMTFGHYHFVRGGTIHEHFHPQKEVWEVIEGPSSSILRGGSSAAS